MSEHETSSEENPVAALEEDVARIARAAEVRSREDRETSSRHRVDLSDERERHAERLAEIERARNDALAAAEALRDDTVEQARRESGGKLAALEDAYETKRRRIVDRSTERAALLKKKMEELIWLADTVFDASEDAPRIEFEKFREQVETLLIEIDGIGTLGRDEMKRFRQRPTEAKPLTNAQTAMIVDDASAPMAQAMDAAAEALASLRSLRFARIFRGGLPMVVALFAAACGAGVAVAIVGTEINGEQIVLGTVCGLLIGIFALGGGWLGARGKVLARWDHLATALLRAHQSGTYLIAQARANRKAKEDSSTMLRDQEIAKASRIYPPLIEEAESERTSLLRDLESNVPMERLTLEERRNQLLRNAEETWQHESREVETNTSRDAESEQVRHEANLAEIEDNYQSSEARITSNWQHDMKRSEDSFQGIMDLSDALHPPFTDPLWKQWTPRPNFPKMIRFGTLDLDLTRIDDALPKEKRFQVSHPEQIDLPAFLGFPHPCSLVVEVDAAAREAGIGLVRSLMLRLLATMPPGKVRFTIIDPVGLGEPFAGFMHLADHDEQLINNRIWTEARHIEQRLLDLTEHMETVIQKYLRNEFESIIEYNEAAGEIAEPLRLLVVCDFPANFTDNSAKRLASISTSGPRCGVHTIVIRDLRREMLEGLDIETLGANAVRILGEDGRWKIDLGALETLPLLPEAPPPDDLVTDIANKVGAAAVQAGRVEVPFDVIAPKSEEYWTASSEKMLSVSLGRSGATKLQKLVLGVGTAQHALIAGKTGSGKSTLLHALITNMACWYSPDEVEFWLVDFKKGVEFKTYATHKLPHARAVAVESDREFGLSVLKGLDEELKRRGDLFRDLGVQDLPGYRNSGNKETMPRVLLIIDEFQELFVEDDKTSQDASLLLDRLVRQGRAFGMHVILGSQTLAGAYSLARSTMGQMGVRVALQCSESDSQIILSDDNSAARLLSRPGEAIYNDQSGLLEGNSPFQVCWLDESVRERCLSKVEELARGRKDRKETIVFEGNKPAELASAGPLEEAIDATSAKNEKAPRAWLGDAIAIKEPTSAVFRRQTAANLLILGQRDDASAALSAAALLSLASQFRAGNGAFTILDGSPADDPAHGLLTELGNALPHECLCPGFREADQAIQDLGVEVARRAEAGITDAPARFLIIHALQRFRSLRRTEDDYGFSVGDDEDKPPTPDRVLATILREGPIHGIHVVIWCDTVASLQRSFDRQSIGEFDQRALFQISSTDSSALMDSPVASRLGFNRALLYSEEQGTVEKFRPWSPPDRVWAIETATRIAQREQGLQGA